MTSEDSDVGRDANDFDLDDLRAIGGSRKSASLCIPRTEASSREGFAESFKRGRKLFGLHARFAHG